MMMHHFLQINSVMIIVYFIFVQERQPTADEQGVLQWAAQAVAVPWYPGNR